eukprot:TRINITY_DN555_c0_g1_i3.p1 TRINITY_DN555_c0_g1~~TRINITY_DN555_c0_g1_i3.p1  ORF type:complete len:126 (-),score=37.26 TRINITY_DN555_c0_g1_i3:354-731(-)
MATAAAPTLLVSGSGIANSDLSAEILRAQVQQMKTFDEAVEFIQNLPSSGPFAADMTTRLCFYKYFKQATVGRCSEHGGTQPWMTQFEKRAKWDAWSALGDMSAEEAKAEYLKLLQNLSLTWKTF